MLDVTNEYLSRDIFSTTLEVAQLLHVIVNSIGDQRDSDHGAFLQAGIPAVMFIYSGYEWVLHTPEDTVDRIDPDKLAEVGKVVTLLAFLYGSVVGSP